MKKHAQNLILITIAIVFVAIIGGIELAPKTTNSAITFDRSDYETLGWRSLLSENNMADVLTKRQHLEQYDTALANDQANTVLSTQLSPKLNQTAQQQQQQSADSVKPNILDRKVRIPGYIVPLEYSATDRRITQFFLVPFYGACIHVPPPPPDQIIYVAAPQGIDRVISTDAFWVAGLLTSAQTENDTATAAYSMQLDFIEPYQN